MYRFCGAFSGRAAWALTPRRDALWSKLQNANFLTRNEKREAAGYGPAPGGDEDDGDSGSDDDSPVFDPVFNPANDEEAEEAQVTWLKPKFNPYHDELGRFTFGPNSGVKPVSDTTGGSAPKTWGNPATLQRHYVEHGSDFSSQSPEDYANQANQFYQRAQNGEVPAVQDSTGIIRAYDPNTNTFGSYNPDGTTRTFYKPVDGEVYFQEQVSRDLSTGGRMINPLPEGDLVPEIEMPPIIE